MSSKLEGEGLSGCLLIIIFRKGVASLFHQLHERMRNIDIKNMIYHKMMPLSLINNENFQKVCTFTDFSRFTLHILEINHSPRYSPLPSTQPLNAHDHFAHQVHVGELFFYELCHVHSNVA